MDFIPIRATTAKYYQSFVPATVRMWNKLDVVTKSVATLNSFKQKIKTSLFTPKTQHLSLGKGRASISHTRMRLGLSPLKQQLHAYNIIPSPYCPHSCCDRVMESSNHFLVMCPKYADSRERLFGVLGATVDITDIILMTNMLLKGHDSLNTSENKYVFEMVQLYITETKRL